MIGACLDSVTFNPQNRGVSNLQALTDSSRFILFLHVVREPRLVFLSM
jgi:hypothetical protein